MSSTDITVKIDPPLLPEGATIVINSDDPNNNDTIEFITGLIKMLSPDSYTGKAEEPDRLQHRDFLECGFRKSPNRDGVFDRYTRGMRAPESFIDQVTLIAEYKPKNGRLILRYKGNSKLKKVYDKKGVSTIYHLEDILEVYGNVEAR